MEKSLLLQKEEFVKDVVDTINGSTLPLFVMEYALKDIMNDVHILIQQELDQEISEIKQAEEIAANEAASSDEATNETDSE